MADDKKELKPEEQTKSGPATHGQQPKTGKDGGGRPGGQEPPRKRH